MVPKKVNILILLAQQIIYSRDRSSPRNIYKVGTYSTYSIPPFHYQNTPLIMFPSISKLSVNRTSHRLARAEKAIGPIFGSPTRAQFLEGRRQNRLVKAEIKRIDNVLASYRTFARHRRTAEFNGCAWAQYDKSLQLMHMNMSAKASDYHQPIGQIRKREVIASISRPKEGAEEERNVNPKRQRELHATLSDDMPQVNHLSRGFSL